jgi:hypothetical protein
MRRAPTAALLGVTCLLWAAIPVRVGGVAPWVLAVAAAAVAFSVLRLLLGWLPRPANELMLSMPARLWAEFHDAMRLPPWEEIATAALVWLEALHRSGAWHTGVLGSLLIAYLLAVHLAESRSGIGVLRTWARVLLLGCAVLAGAALLGGLVTPATGSPGAVLRVLACAAAVIAAALALPAHPSPPAPGPGPGPGPGPK